MRIVTVPVISEQDRRLLVDSVATITRVDVVAQRRRQNVVERASDAVDRVARAGGRAEPGDDRGRGRVAADARAARRLDVAGDAQLALLPTLKLNQTFKDKTAPTLELDRTDTCCVAITFCGLGGTAIASACFGFHFLKI